MNNTHDNFNKINEAMNAAVAALATALLKNKMRRYNEVVEQMTAHGWDFHAAFPYPSAFDFDYMNKRIEYNFAAQVTQSIVTCPSPNRPDYRKLREGVTERFVQEADRDATTMIRAYAQKLAGKVTAADADYKIASVEYTGRNDPFAASVLRMVDAAGNTMVWSTRCILNCSCKGKLFNQWPTRKVTR